MKLALVFLQSFFFFFPCGVEAAQFVREDTVLLGEENSQEDQVVPVVLSEVEEIKSDLIQRLNLKAGLTPESHWDAFARVILIHKLWTMQQFAQTMEGFFNTPALKRGKELSCLALPYVVYSIMRLREKNEAFSFVRNLPYLRHDDYQDSEVRSSLIHELLEALWDIYISYAREDQSQDQGNNAASYGFYEFPFKELCVSFLKEYGNLRDADSVPLSTRFLKAVMVDLAHSDPQAADAIVNAIYLVPPTEGGASDKSIVDEEEIILGLVSEHIEDNLRRRERLTEG